MARSEKTIHVQDGENSLKVIIKPMSAVKAERWMLKAAMAVGGSALTLGRDSVAEDIAKALSQVEYEKVAPLWDELLLCCQLDHDGVITDLTPETIEGKIDYPTTLFIIKVAAIQANFGFFGNGGFAKFLTAMRGVLT